MGTSLDCVLAQCNNSVTSLHAGNVSDIYDVPRASISPDEEGIYDDPYDILDMEIYDYPPDVTDLYRFLEESSLDTPEHSTRTSTITVTTDRTSSTISEDSWRTMSLPPLPPGARPFSVISSDEYQVKATCRTLSVCVCVFIDCVLFEIRLLRLWPLKVSSGNRPIISTYL